MSHYKPYPAYKDSGIKWLGDIPERWDVKRLRFVATPKNSNVDKKTYEGQLDIKLCNYTDVYYNETITAALDFMPSTASVSEIETFSLHAGDVIFTKDSETADDIGIPAYVSQNLPGVVCGYHLTMLKSHGVDGEFLFRLLQAHLTKAYFFIEVSGVTRFGLGQDAINNIVVPLPARDEQRVLCNWMSNETTRIDALVSKKTRFIELLREKRQALITHAVTKGLDPNVKKKDSGEEWLGDVPVHWGIGPLKFFCLVIDCKHFTVEFLDEGLPIVSIRELHNDKIDLSNAKLTSPNEWDFLREGRKPQYGDMVLCRNASVGAVGFVERDVQFCMGQDVCLIRPNITSRFSHYQLASPVIRDQIEAFLVGATIRRANVEEIRNLFYLCPPEQEQHAISVYLDKETLRIDALITKTERSIELLKERRSALITAAVTGQIDLREAA